MKIVQNQFTRTLRVLQTDCGTEFLNHNVHVHLENNGTFHHISSPYTLQQNGRVERKHRHVVETGLAMMFNAHVPPDYWVEAFSATVFIINRLPTKVLDLKSPYELAFSYQPDYTNLRTFGYRVYLYLRDYAQHKLSPHSLRCVFLGYSHNTRDIIVPTHLKIEVISPHMPILTKPTFPSTHPRPLLILLVYHYPHF